MNKVNNHYLCPNVWCASVSVLLVTCLHLCAWQSVAAANLPRYSIHVLALQDDTHSQPGVVPRSSVRGVGNDGASESGVIGFSDRDTIGNGGESGWLFTREDQQIQQIGLLDREFFFPPGETHRTLPWQINDRGQVVGTTATDGGNSTSYRLGWFFDPQTEDATRIGYSTIADPANSVNDSPEFLQPNGLVVGTSMSNTSGTPRRAWIFNPNEGITRQIGLPDTADLGGGLMPNEHTIDSIAPGSRVVGTATSGNSRSSAVWVYDPDDESTTRIGFFDAAYEYNDAGQKLSSFGDSNANGLVAGTSAFAAGNAAKYGAWVYDLNSGITEAIGFGNPVSGSNHNDQILAATRGNLVHGKTIDEDGSDSPWIYDHASKETKKLGLFDAEHINRFGRTENEVIQFNDSYILGKAERGVGAVRGTFNATPWIYSIREGNLMRAGLTEGDYTSPDGSRNATAIQINNAGQAIGYSRLFGGSNFTIIRDSPWLFDPASGETIELAQSLSTSRSITFSRPFRLNNRGQVVGIATNSTGLGDFVWFYDHATGRTEVDFDIRDEFTVTRGGADLSLLDLTESGLVLGRSDRHQANGGDAGHTLWIYDSASSLTHDLVFSMDSRGNAFTTVEYLSDDGVVFGEYDAYDESDQLTGRRNFYWSVDDGFHDLESLIVGDLSAQGWESIVHPLDSFEILNVVDQGFVLGRALRNDGNYLPFALIQVPEPSIPALFWVVAFAFVLRRRQDARSRYTLKRR